MADRNQQQNQNQGGGRGYNASGPRRPGQGSGQQNRSGGQGFAGYGRTSGQSGGFGSYDRQPGTRLNSSTQQRGQGQQQEDWGTQPYYGGYGYDFKGEGFGGWAQGYPNPGFGSQTRGQSGGSGQGQRQSTSGSQSGSGPHVGKGPKRSDERIQDDVIQRLTEHGHLDASNVDVQVHEGEVTLSGTVDSRSAKRMAEDVADSVSGVKDVHNRLSVQQSGQQSQQGQEVVH